MSHNFDRLIPMTHQMSHSFFPVFSSDNQSSNSPHESCFFGFEFDFDSDFVIDESSFIDSPQSPELSQPPPAPLDAA